MVILGAPKFPALTLGSPALADLPPLGAELTGWAARPLPAAPAPGPAAPADGFDVGTLPGAEASGLRAFIAAHPHDFDGAVDTPAELKKLLQMLNQGEGRAAGLPQLEARPGLALDGMNGAELLQLLIDYLRDFGPQGQSQGAAAGPPRMLGTLGGGGGAGRAVGGGGAGGGGAGGAPGAVVPSNARAQGTADVAGVAGLSAEQKQNAKTIIDVGHRMGASERDIQVALMTAMQESSLRNLNYGDRDSVGLFQQRPSCGWGTVDQIMNPEYAASKFYEGLLKLPNRDAMSLTQAAQAVQRSGFPDAYAKWEGLARGLLDQVDAGARGAGPLVA